MGVEFFPESIGPPRLRAPPKGSEGAMIPPEWQLPPVPFEKQRKRAQRPRPRSATSGAHQRCRYQHSPAEERRRSRDCRTDGLGVMPLRDSLHTRVDARALTAPSSAIYTSRRFCYRSRHKVRRPPPRSSWRPCTDAAMTRAAVGRPRDGRIRSGLDSSSIRRFFWSTNELRDIVDDRSSGFT